MIPIIIFAVIMSLLLSFIYFKTSEEKDKNIEKRMNQSKNLFAENVLNEKLLSSIEKRAKPSKKEKIKKELTKAGFSNVQYAQFALVRIIFSILFTIIAYVIIPNPLTLMIFLGIGYVLPTQILKLLSNNRTNKLNAQVGSLMDMVTKRYENTKDFHKAFELTINEFEGVEPIYSEMNRTLAQMNIGVPVEKALNDFAERIDNKFMKRYAAYYEIVASIGKDDLRKELLNQAYKQYEEDNNLKRMLKKEISGPKNDAFIMWGFTILVALYNSVMDDNYIYFMTKTSFGQLGTLAIIVVLIFTLWFINVKIAGPLD